MLRAALFLMAVGLSLPGWTAEAGGIEGRAWIGSAPARAARILVDGYGAGSKGKHWETETDAQGRFAVRDLPAGKYRVSRLVMFDQMTAHGTTRTGTGTHAVRAEVKDATNTVVTLGGSGRTVVGRLVAGAALADRRLAFTAGEFRFLTLNEKRDDGFPGRHLVLDIQADGAVRCQDVPPGNYELYVTVRNAAGRLDAREVGSIQRTVTIPQDGAGTGKPHDLGKLELELVKE